MERDLTFKDAAGLIPAEPQAAPKVPWHVTLIAGAAVVWSLLAVFDFLAIVTRFSPYMNQIPEMTREFIYATPFWALLLRAAAVFTSLVGAVLLLRRRIAAVRMLAAAATATILSIGFGFARPVPDEGTAVFGVCIVVVSVLLLYYAQTLARRGVLK